jgi:hypothetical protein
MLVKFFQSLSRDYHPGAMAVLVAGDVVELAVCHMAKEGVDVLHCGLELVMFISHRRSLKRMRAPGASADRRNRNGVAEGAGPFHNTVVRPCSFSIRYMYTQYLYVS